MDEYQDVQMKKVTWKVHLKSIDFPWLNSGLGGGFNERGRVEYRSHDSDEDEYDKYGRRKKNVRKNSESKDRRISGDSSKDRLFEHPVEAKHDDEDEVDEEEEEEEDDDEEDLVIILMGPT